MLKLKLNNEIMNLKWEIAHNEKRLLLSVPPYRLYLVGGHRGLVRLEGRAGLGGRHHITSAP